MYATMYTKKASYPNTATANVINLQITSSWAKNKVNIWP